MEKYLIEKMENGNLHGLNLVPDGQLPEHCVNPRIPLTFLHNPCGGITVLIKPIVDDSDSDSARQFCCCKVSILHFVQHPSMYFDASAHSEISGQDSISDAINV